MCEQEGQIIAFCKNGGNVYLEKHICDTELGYQQDSRMNEEMDPKYLKKKKLNCLPIISN